MQLIDRVERECLFKNILWSVNCSKLVAALENNAFEVFSISERAPEATSEVNSAAAESKEKLMALQSDVVIFEGGAINEICIYPAALNLEYHADSLNSGTTMEQGEVLPMITIENETQLVLAVVKDHPLHLWDARTRILKASYSPMNHLDELESVSAACFNQDGSAIFCGGISNIKGVSV
jgi:hypothetical protein